MCAEHEAELVFICVLASSFKRSQDALYETSFRELTFSSLFKIQITTRKEKGKNVYISLFLKKAINSQKLMTRTVNK